MGIFKNDDKQSSAFGFDEKSMAGKAVKAVRWRRHNPAQPGLLDRDAHHACSGRRRLWLDRRGRHVDSGVRAFV